MDLCIFKERDSEYLIVSSRRSRVSGGGVVFRDGTCKLSLPDALLYAIGEPADISQTTPTVMRGLALDLFRRYAQAFGGKTNFLRAVRQDGLSPSDLPAAFRREFEAYSSEP